jgi:hypothetical protein
MQLFLYFEILRNLFHTICSASAAFELQNGFGRRRALSSKAWHAELASSPVQQLHLHLL